MPLWLSAQNNLHYEIKGVDKGTKENILKRIELSSKKLNKKASSVEIQRFTHALPKEIKKAMQPYGYYSPKISVYQRLYRKRSIIHIDIKPGRPIRIHSLSIQVTGPGAKHPDYQAVKLETQMKEGDILRIPYYNQTKLAFFHIAEKLGYLKAKMITTEIKIDLEKSQADIILHFETGKQFYFGKIEFEKTPLNQDFLKRYLKIKPGETYSTKKLLKLQDALRSSVYFRHVRIDSKINQAKYQRVPIFIELEPSKSQLFTLGIGYGTDTNIRGTVGWEKRRVNTYGHRFQTRLQASPVQSSLQARYIIPGPYPATDEYQIYSTALRQKTKQNDSIAILSGVSYVFRWREWLQSINLNYLMERKHSIDNVPHLTSHWLYPSLTLRRIHAKNPINTKNGYRISIHLLGAHDALLAHDSFFQMKIESKYIHSFSNKFRILLRDTFGYIAVNDINNLAANLQFFAGGAQSVRGYKYQSLGPGKYIIVGSAELQYNFFDKWRFATFFDVGNASNRFSTSLKRGIGIGISRSTPVGSVDFGIARPLDSEKKNINFIFSLGPDLA